MTKQEAYEVFLKAYEILMAHAGARNTCGERETFAKSFTEKEWVNRTSEWRFQGLIGFGGKFRLGGNRIYIDCYPEERCKKTDKLIDKVNKLLSELPFPGYPPYEES